MSDVTLPIVVYSHLRWDSVFQRPHQIMSRIAKRRPVFFMEEPVADPGPAHWETWQPVPGLTVCRLRTPVQSAGFAAALLPTLVQMSRSLLVRACVGRHAAWLYTPLALPLARALRPEVIAYDCMDELTGFLHAPTELAAREAELLRCADVAFMGGRSLYRAKRERNPHMYCFPSSVDAAHFHQACGGRLDHADQSALAHPRLGFFGVIEERMDLALLEAIADARPAWQIVLVGPVVKIRPETLPRRPNLRYMGQRAYADLPAFIGGWDVCLLPFALNAATRFISPTKTLEYMAAERPIVSTPITDVVEPYGDIVRVAATPDAFVAACERALGAGSTERAVDVARMRDVLAQTSWDATAQAMERKLERACRRRRAHARPAARSRVRGRPTVDIALSMGKASG